MTIIYNFFAIAAMAKHKTNQKMHLVHALFIKGKLKSSRPFVLNTMDVKVYVKPAAVSSLNWLKNGKIKGILTKTC